MKASNKFIKAFALAMALSTVGVTVYANTELQAGVEQQNQQAPIITGIEDVSVQVGGQLDLMAGVKAYDQNGQDITAQVTRNGYVKTDKQGQYIVVYTVTDSQGITTQAPRKVTVSDATTQTVFSGIELKIIEQGAVFNPLEGISVYDTTDGDLTKSIKFTSYVDSTDVTGTYPVWYSVENSLGQETLGYTLVIVEEKKEARPVINGLTDVHVAVGGSYSLLDGVTATGKTGVDISGTIGVSGNFSTETPGTFTITYFATDIDGERVEQLRKIIVG